MLLKSTAKYVAPMAECGIVHKKWEVERKKEARNAVNKPYKKKMKVSIEMELIANFLSCRKSNVRKPSWNEVIAPRKKKARTAKATLPKDTANEIVDVTIPLPTDTTTMIYTKPEVAIILAQIKKKQRSAV